MIDKDLLLYDPSMYTFYQMLEYTRNVSGITLHYHKTDNLLLVKTMPCYNSYNYAHVFFSSRVFSIVDLNIIKDFFASENYYIKVPDDQDIKNILDN